MEKIKNTFNLINAIYCHIGRTVNSKKDIKKEEVYAYASTFNSQNCDAKLLSQLLDIVVSYGIRYNSKNTIPGYDLFSYLKESYAFILESLNNQTISSPYDPKWQNIFDSIMEKYKKTQNIDNIILTQLWVTTISTVEDYQQNKSISKA